MVSLVQKEFIPEQVLILFTFPQTFKSLNIRSESDAIILFVTSESKSLVQTTLAVYWDKPGNGFVLVKTGPLTITQMSPFWF